ncbi:MAG: type II secretion system protein [Gammaproteobacteria bacterium]|nr:type II secretion system protein [Gammaproteobacteria bacterium]MCY4211907.1 type II secretion system protein [Gammaproteobacteria bacterium]MCY4283268.1 type II secretion system protein [Gammaproteobacteria bacterium]MCY4339073.1 type II secretion system protein [Gammaproteobacteria bacterium]
MHKHKEAGFSLLELAIALMIMALLVGGMLNPLSATLEAKRRARAQLELEQIREALLGFAMINGYLPCPTTSADPAVEAYGLADPVCNGEPAAEGYLPWRTLGVPEVDPWGLPRHATTDPFNGYWRYRVDRNFADAAALITLGAAPDDNLSITDPRGLLLTAPTETPVAIIYSAGANLQPDGENTSFEGAPCGNPGGYAPGGSATCPDGEPHYQGGDMYGVGADATFDDMLIWLSRPLLFNRLVAAGRLP